MAHLEKTVISSHGVSANCWALEVENTASVVANGLRIRGNLNLWLDVAAYNAGKEILDSCKFDVIIAGPSPVLIFEAIKAIGVHRAKIGPVDFSDAILLQPELGV